MHAELNRLEDDREGHVGKEVLTRRRIDVTDMDAASLRRYVSEQIDTDHVSLEHRGSHTYLLVER